MAAKQRETTMPNSAAEAQLVETQVGRRTFAKAYKQHNLTEADACKHGEVGLLLRREGLYHATLAVADASKLKQGDAGAIGGQKRGIMRKYGRAEQ